jgi:branched-chain amino acid transport system permease protein
VTSLLQQIFNALALGGMYLLVALGITLIYGLTRVVNFAQGEMVTLGAFVCFALTQAGVPFGLALVATVVLVGAGSEVLDIGLFRRTITRPFNGFVISLGLIVALEAAYAIIWPQSSYSIPAPFSGVWEVAGLHLDQARVLLLVVTIVVSGALLLALEKTPVGSAVRAAAENRMAARVLGVRVGRLTALTFMTGSGLAALAGGLLGTIFQFNSVFGGRFLVAGFAVAIIGGLGSVRGAVVAALIISLAETLGGAYISLPWSTAFSLLAMVVMIMWRPRGLFRGTESGDSVMSAEEALSFGAGASVPKTGGDRRARVTTVLVPRLFLIAAVVVVALAPFFIPTSKLLSEVTYAMIIATAAYGMWFVFRYAGVFSIAQAAFMGIGAYSSALAVTHWNLTFWLQLPLAIVLGALTAALMGVVALRTSGSYFLIVTFALTELVVNVLNNWQSFTGGSLGLVQPARPTPFGDAIDFTDPYNFFWFVLALLLAVIAVAHLAGRSAFGRRLTTIRDNEVLARSLGINTFAHKLAAFSLGGALAGLAGISYVYNIGSLQPTLFGAFPGINIALAVILGGVGVLSGPALGSVLFVLLPEILGLSPDANQLINGLLLIAVIVFLPRGLGGALRDGYLKLVSRRAPPPTAPPPAAEPAESVQVAR